MLRYFFSEQDLVNIPFANGIGRGLMQTAAARGAHGKTENFVCPGGTFCLCINLDYTLINIYCMPTN